MKHDYNFSEYLKKVLTSPIDSQCIYDDNFNKSNLSSSYYNDLKEKLLIKYKNKSLHDIFNCKTHKSQYGDVLKITKKEKINFTIFENNFKNEILNNLKFLPKIGIKTEEKLKKQGYTSINSLINHDKYNQAALKFLSKIDEMSYFDIIELLNNNKYSQKCRDNVLKSISMVDAENFKFMDIETKGLSNVPIILIGIAEIKGINIISSQYFLRSYAEEISIIDAYLSHLDESSVHVTFNGKSFDVPFIKNRCLYNRIECNLDLAHLDLMYFAKNIWSNKLPDCKLQTIEKGIFGIERKDDVPGKYIPDYYDTYLSDNNIGPVVPIIEHNAQDIISLAIFLQRMYEEVN